MPALAGCGPRWGGLYRLYLRGRACRGECGPGSACGRRAPASLRLSLGLLRSGAATGLGGWEAAALLARLVPAVPTGARLPGPLGPCGGGARVVCGGVCPVPTCVNSALRCLAVTPAVGAAGAAPPRGHPCAPALAPEQRCCTSAAHVRCQCLPSF